MQVGFQVDPWNYVVVNIAFMAEQEKLRRAE
jgi:hypothetical protein